MPSMYGSPNMTLEPTCSGSSKVEDSALLTTMGNAEGNTTEAPTGDPRNEAAVYIAVGAATGGGIVLVVLVVVVLAMAKRKNQQDHSANGKDKRFNRPNSELSPTPELSVRRFARDLIYCSVHTLACT